MERFGKNSWREGLIAGGRGGRLVENFGSECLPRLWPNPLTSAGFAKTACKILSPPKAFPKASGLRILKTKELGPCFRGFGASRLRLDDERRPGFQGQGQRSHQPVEMP